MGKIKTVAAAMAVIMLMPVLMSCSSGKKKNNVVKADDPWYESTRFRLDKDIRQNEELGDAQICIGTDRIYSIYPLSKDMWGSCRTVLDTYDFDGNLLDRKEVTCEGDMFVRWIFAFSADPDGKTLNAALFVVDGDKFYPAFAEIDIGTGTVSGVKDMLNRGKVYLNEIYKVSLIEDYAIVTLNNSAGTASLSFSLMLYKNTELIGELDLEQPNLISLLDGFSIDHSTESLYVSGFADGGASMAEYDLNTGKYRKKSSFQQPDDKTDIFGEFTATDNGDLCKLDTFGNIMKIDVNTMTPVTVIDSNWYSPLFNPTDAYGLNTTSMILSCGAEITVILERQYVTYGMDDYNTYEHITVLKKADKNPHAGKEIIELALPLYCSGVSDYLARAICEFNRTDDEYLIRVWSKHNTGVTIGRGFTNASDYQLETYEMIQELKGDEAPDIAIGIQSNYAMRDDVFMDLSEFLDPEVMDKQYTNIIEAGRIDGKLYFLPVTLEIEGLVTNADLLKDGAEGVTFEEFDKIVKEDMNGFSPYDYVNSFAYNKTSFILSCIDTKKAIEGEKVDFGTEQFRSAVEYAKDNFQYDDWSQIPIEYVGDWDVRQKGECYYAKLGNYLEFVHACYKSEGRYLIVGTPSVDASGPRFRALETISVSATTDVEAGCRKFINYLFSGEAFSSSDCEFRQIVTNKEIMNKNINILTKRNNDAYEAYLASKESGAIRVVLNAEKAYADKTATDEMRESFLNSMATISTYYYEDDEIINIVSEEVAPYYAGDRSIDDAVTIINDRVTKYIREM